MSVNVVILAAGKGTRMQSDLPKVLHNVAFKPMIEHVINTAKNLMPNKIQLIYGHAAELMQEKIKAPVTWVYQHEQNGTGHAVAQALPNINNDDMVLILYGDVPLIKSTTLANLVEKTPKNGLGILTVTLDDATGYGRIIRDNNGKIVKIVEQKDATQIELKICEGNTGIMCINGKMLHKWLALLNNDNAQKEYYLTDIVAMAYKENIPIVSEQPQNIFEVLGANDRGQLAELERHFQRDYVNLLLKQGVTIMDPNRIDIRGNLQVGKDSTLDVNTIFNGEVKIGENVFIGAGSILTNCIIEDNTTVEPYSIIDGASIGVNCSIGPFARIRPGTKLLSKVKVGNFVEVKKSTIGEHSKVNHLSYIGDAEVGSKVNIGAGCITCNYDGVNKHQTKIENNVFIGSTSQLVAPVTIKEGATIGAGSTITSDVGVNELAITRVRQRNITGWIRPKK